MRRAVQCSGVALLLAAVFLGIITVRSVGGQTDGAEYAWLVSSEANLRATRSIVFNSRMGRLSLSYQSLRVWGDSTLNTAADWSLRRLGFRSWHYPKSTLMWQVPVPALLRRGGGGSFGDFGYAIGVLDEGTSPDTYIRSGWIVSAPAWGVTLLVTILAVFCWLPTVRRFRRRRSNRCLECGYDLRATPDCCPECGWRTVQLLNTEKPPAGADFDVKT